MPQFYKTALLIIFSIIKPNMNIRKVPLNDDGSQHKRRVSHKKHSHKESNTHVNNVDKVDKVDKVANQNLSMEQIKYLQQLQALRAQQQQPTPTWVGRIKEWWYRTSWFTKALEVLAVGAVLVGAVFGVNKLRGGRAPNKPVNINKPIRKEPQKNDRLPSNELPIENKSSSLQQQLPPKEGLCSKFGAWFIRELRCVPKKVEIDQFLENKALTIEDIKNKIAERKQNRISLEPIWSWFLRGKYSGEMTRLKNRLITEMEKSKKKNNDLQVVRWGKRIS